MASTFMHYVSQRPRAKQWQAFNAASLRQSFLIVKHFRKLSVLCFSPPEIESIFPAITYGGRQSASDRQSCETNAAPGSVQKSCVLTPYPRRPEQMVCGVGALGDRDHPEGGVGRSAHQMTSYPSIDFFFFNVDSWDSLTHGNWAVVRTHVPAFAVHRLGGGPLWGRTPPEIKIA